MKFDHKKILAADNMSERAAFWILTAILFCGLALRLAYCMARPLMKRDEIVYIQLIQVWPDYSQCGLNNSTYLPSLFMQTAAWLTRIGVSPYLAGVMISLLSGMGLLVLIYLISVKLTSSRGLGLLAALLAAVHPVLVQFSVSVLRESLYLFLSATMLYFLTLAAANPEKNHFWALSGCFGALGFMARIESWEFLPLVVGVVMLLCCCKRMPWRRGVFAVCIGIGCFLFVVLAGEQLRGNPSDFSNMYRYYIENKMLSQSLD